MAKVANTDRLAAATNLPHLLARPVEIKNAGNLFIFISSGYTAAYSQYFYLSQSPWLISKLASSQKLVPTMIAWCLLLY